MTTIFTLDRIDYANSYDARAAGSLCDRCSLKGQPVVPSEGAPAHALLGCIAEAPGATEEELGQPLVGPSGRLFNKALGLADIDRSDCWITNVCLCRPPEGSMNTHMLRLGQRNRVRIKQGKEPLLAPTLACRPRLLRELAGRPKGLLLMGAYARAAFYPGERGETGLMSSRGFPSKCLVEFSPNDYVPFPTLATIHPAFALRAGRWINVFVSDVAKAGRMVRGQLRWKDPEMLYDPTPDELANFLSTLTKAPAFDTETSGLDLFNMRLDLVGIGNWEKVVCVKLHSVEGGLTRLQTTPGWMERTFEILRNWFADPKGLVLMHNSPFDEAVCKRCIPGFVINRRVFDTILAHHAAWSELPHDLGFLSAQYTDSPAHKVKDHHWTDDRKRMTYNMLDVAVTSWAGWQLAQDQKLIEQKVVLESDHKLSRFCQGLHAIGMHLNLAERDLRSSQLSVAMEAARQDIHQMLDAVTRAEGGEQVRARFSSRSVASFNPGSPDQVRDLLFTDLKFVPQSEKKDKGAWTKSGNPSVNKVQLYSLLDIGVPPLIDRLVLRIIDYREASKLRGTYCTIEPARDGRVHSNWKPHVAVSGRLSGSDPNLMNLEGSLRGMYDAGPGHVFVYCDKAQLEARVTAWLAQQKDQIDAFLRGDDIHKVNACAVMGYKRPEDVPPMARQFTKTFVYAVQYLAKVPKVHQMLRCFVDESGARPYRGKTLTEIEALFTAFWAKRQSIMAFHKRNRVIQKDCGYLKDAIQGRRRYFTDGDGDDEVIEEKANFIIQSSSAADVNEATWRLLEEFPFGFDGPYTGIVHQCHDSIVIECKESHAMDVGRRMVYLMNSKLGDMPLPVDLAIGTSYGNVKKVKIDSVGFSHVWNV